MAVWTTGDVIGDAGGYGVVCKTKRKEGNVTGDLYYAKKKLIKIDEDSVKRFQREVRISERLNHPNIVDIVAKNLNSEPYFYIMPLYNNSMQAIMSEIKEDYKRIKTIFNKIFDGVEYMHSEGVYHRDLKPANILMNSDTDMVISDFGLGVQIDSETERFTRTSIGMGTFFFISPEQELDFKHVDERSDIYSLGCMLYLCLIPEERDTFVRIEKLPPIINNVVRKATAYKKEDRYTDIDLFRKAFNSAIDRISGIAVKEKAEEILDQIRTGDTSEALIDEISLIMNASLKNPDDIHELIMALAGQQFELIAANNLEVLKSAALVFKEQITSQGWSFNYTDKIGHQCKNLYYSIENYELRAILIYIIIQVGSSHNRWHVIDLARNILLSIKNDEEAFEVASYIKPLSMEIENLRINTDSLYGDLKDI